ncbi:hypothetical protein C8J56DRAFT_759773, partial [Mycena floridula]
WLDILPGLDQPYLEYLNASIGVPPELSSSLRSKCTRARYFIRAIVHACSCTMTNQVLVANGLFPCTPISPHFAVAIPLLNFYRAMFERSCDSITAFAAALNTAYERRGFRMISHDGARIKDPFRKSLGNAVQWYDVLQCRTEDIVSQALQECDDRIQAEKPPGARMGPTPESLADETETAQSIPHPVDEIETVNDDTPETTEIKLTPGECHRILREACPCCFGGSLFGRSFNQDGGDIHVAIDGNFHHKHVRGAGANNEFYQNRRFLSKEYIDAVGERLAQAKKRPAKAYTSPVSEATINGCRESHHAAKGDDAGDGAEGNGKGIEFDDKGIMALVCRHDIPILLANIDTPGKQQKYAVALIEAFCQMIPREATSTFCYDVACVLDVSVSKYDFLPDWILDRVLFVTSAM